MAKVGFWLRGAKGKLAGATVYKDGQGNTVMREVVTPSNPKTASQMIQRIIMHTVQGAYSKMKDICDHSFEGVKKGQDCMSRFVSLNVGYAREKINSMQAQGVEMGEIYNFAPLGLRGFTPNSYQVAMGSLPRIDVTFFTGDNSGCYISGNFENTYQGVCDALGLKRGDQLTFLVIERVGSGQEFGQNEFHFCRVILDPTDPETFLQKPMSTPFVVDGAINCPSVRNEGNFAFTVNAAGLSFQKTYAPAAAAVIASRQQGETWLRSTAFMTYRSGLGTTFSLGECLERAMSGVSAPIYTANEQYLNNAGEGGGAAEATGADDPSSGGGTSGGGNTNAVVVQSVTFDNQTATVGTPIVKEIAELPANVATVVRLSSVGDAMSIIVKKNGVQVGDDHWLNAGQASFNIEIPAAGYGTYALYSGNEDGVETALGYSIRIDEPGDDEGAQ